MKKPAAHNFSPNLAPVRLGLMPPLSGLVALYGREISHAGRIATQEVNEAGGVLGRPLELAIADDGSLPETAVPAAKKLIDEYGCTAIIGNLLSNSRISVAYQVAEPRRVPYLNFSFYEGSIFSRYFFHFAALPNQQIDKMIPFMKSRFGPKFFFAGSNYEWPVGSIAAAKLSLEGCGGEVVGEEYRPMGTVDMSDLIAAVEKSGADVFVPYFAGTDQVNLLTAFAEHGLKERMQVVMGHYDEAMVSLLAPEIREGFYSSNTYFMSVDTPVNKAYLERLGAMSENDGLWPHGKGVLTNFGEGTYVCVHAFAKAANTVGSLDREDIVDALKTISLEGPQGHVEMDPLTHHAHVNCHLSRCRADGSFDIIRSFGTTRPIIPDRYARSLAEYESLSLRPDQGGGAGGLKRPMPMPAQEIEGKLDAWAAKLNFTDTDSIGDINASITEEITRDPGARSRILECADVGIIATDTDGIIVEANPGACDLFGYTEEEMIGLSVHLLLPPAARNRHKQDIKNFATGPRDNLPMGQRGEISGYRKDGSIFPAEASVSRIISDGKMLLVATLRDVTTRKEAEEELYWQATHDPLTRLPNRTLISERLHNALSRVDRSGKRIAVLFVDLDNFKLINDGYGHEVGDRVLETVAKRLVGAVRGGDTVGRFGGDEFVILCEQVENQAAIAYLLERISEAMRRPMNIDDHQLYVTASTGVVFGGDAADSVETMMRNADIAMYQAKEGGRDRWKMYSEELHIKARDQLDIANGLRAALKKDEFRIYIQPIIDVASKRIVGGEVLLRWYRDKEIVSPAEFIPVAEMTGVIRDIGEWVLRKTCETQIMLRRRSDISNNFFLSANVSSKQFAHGDLAASFKRIIRETGADPQRITLEITETALMADVEHNVGVLEDLGASGFHVAIDDFGTGYSSLGQLVRLPVNSLKVDRMFVDGLKPDSPSFAVVSTVISMAQSLGIKTVAEGVETREQLKLLQQLGCDQLQGFLFYRPMNVHDFEDLLSVGGEQVPDAEAV